VRRVRYGGYTVVTRLVTRVRYGLGIVPLNVPPTSVPIVRHGNYDGAYLAMSVIQLASDGGHFPSVAHAG
jgi:hypothetical protein